MSSPARSACGLWLSLLVLALTITATLSTTTHSQSRTVHASSASQPISPAVIAAWSAHADPPGAAMLDFLALLRGEPGWFMGSERSESSGSTSSDGHEPGPMVMHMSHGIHSVELRFDPAALTLTVQDQVVSLQGANVVLVDGVDSPDGLRVDSVLWVDPQLPDLEPSFVQSLVRKEPAIFPFLRCEAGLEDAAAQQMFDALCARMRPE